MAWCVPTGNWNVASLGMMIFRSPFGDWSIRVAQMNSICATTTVHDLCIKNARQAIVVSDGEEDDGDDRQHIRNRNRNKNVARIESGTAVNELNFFQFCSLLIENLNIRFHENNVAWPKRLARATPRHVPVMIEA